MDEMDSAHGPETPPDPDLPTDGEKDRLDREWEILDDSLEAHMERTRMAFRRLGQTLKKSLGFD